MEESKEKFGLKIYEKKPHEDFLFVKLWFKWLETGDVHNVMRPDRKTLLEFFDILHKSSVAIYGIDQNNEIDFLFVIEPASDVPEEKTVLIGILWSDEKKRGNRLTIQRVNFILSEIFKKFENCFAVTWLDKIVNIHKKFGFCVVGFFPSIYNIDNVYSTWLTKENFEKSKAYRLFNKE